MLTAPRLLSTLLVVAFLTSPSRGAEKKNHHLRRNLKQNGQGQQCETITVTWLVKEIIQNGALAYTAPGPPMITFEQGDTLLISADLCEGTCNVDNPVRKSGPQGGTFGRRPSDG